MKLVKTKKYKPMNHSRGTYWRKRRAFFFLFGLFAIFGVGALVMGLWNAILPSLLHVSPINYWQAMGLFVLSRLLFGGFRFGGNGPRPGYGKTEWRQKFMNMSEEERQKFQREWKERCKPNRE